jgi:chromosomal replication initiation ATPase DnaA
MYEHIEIKVKTTKMAHSSDECFTPAMVANLYGVPIDDLFAHTRRGPRAAFARQVAMYLMHVVYGITMSDVATAFGRHPSTVAHACHRMEDLRDDPQLDCHLTQLEDLLRAATGSEATS